MHAAETVEAASAAGIESFELDDEGRASQEQIAELQAAMSTTIGDVEHIARAVEYVIAQPIELGIDELVIRPQKNLF